MIRQRQSDSIRFPLWFCWPAVRAGLLLLMAAIALTSPGCSCREETPAERAAREEREEAEAERRRKEAEQNKKQPPLVIQPPIPQPGPEEIVSLVVKPGHWMTAKQSLKPNYEDWVGEATLQVVDGDRQPIPIDRTAFALRSTRDVALSKGQEKGVESVVFVPAKTGPLRFRSALRERGAALVDPPDHPALKRMAPHQHHFVVLGPEAQRYRYLGSLKSVNAPFSSEFDLYNREKDYDFALQYRVVLQEDEERTPIPDNPLCWTSVAYVLWDEVDPELLDASQQAAILDWLHWGGQLVISGPDSLDLLADSFLAPYLPADSGGAREITPDDLRGLSETWDISDKGDQLTIVGKWSGVKLKPRPEADPSGGAGDLFAERRVGRGRVIVSAMQLAERDLINWQGGFENLFNNLVLRRPPRRFAYDDNAFTPRSETPGVVYVARSSQQIDASTNSRLRYFARDTHAKPDAWSYAVGKAEDEPGGPTGGFRGPFGGQNRGDFASLQLKNPAAVGGPAGWNDFNAAATAARESLREAAGVNVPGSGFVMLCLGVYLAVLAPFNWLFFRAIGRVELAWVAAPIIAILGTWVVVKQAQLDIGFVRAQTEIAILETQPDHPRGHLTRYLSFYTSLSTTYDLEFENPTTVAAPLARSDQSALLAGQRPGIALFERQERARLRGLSVSSNTTDMAHAEQMVDLGGVLKYDPDRRRLTNESDQEFTSLAVVRRPATGGAVLQGSWIGDLGGRTTTPVSFPPVTWEEGTSPFADRRAPPEPIGPAGEEAAKAKLNLEPLFALALDPARLEPGEVRAVAVLEGVFPGVTVTPEASQQRGATLVVAHLEYAPLPTPKSDANAPVDYMPKR